MADRLSPWARRTQWPLSAAAVAFLVAYAVPVVRPGVSPAVRTVCSAVVGVTWATFALDYLVRLRLARDKKKFFVRHLVDLAAVVLPLLRPFALLRLVAPLAVLGRVGARTLRGRVATYVIAGTALLVITGALAVTKAERGAPGATIHNVGDGVWWALSTITTVGYGDKWPSTVTGRVVGGVLMFGGIALVGVVTATVASWLVERVVEVDEAQQAATRAQVDTLTRQVTVLTRELTALRRTLDGEAPATRGATVAGRRRPPARPPAREAGQEPSSTT